MSDKKKTISTITHLQNEVERLIGDAHDVDFIANLLASKSYIVDETVALHGADLKTKVVKFCNEYAPYQRIQRLKANTLIMPINRRNWFIWDAESYRVYKTDREMVTKDFNKKQDYLRKSEQVSVVYMPKNKYGLIEYQGELVFNSYRAPHWLEDHYRHGKPLPIVEHVPAIYEKFLLHLVGGDTLSYNYILDWLAISLQSRNHVFLVTIGRAGVGKGFLGKIIDALHGEDNSSTVEYATIQSNFNSVTTEKTFVYYNEVSRMTEKDKVRAKTLNDDKVRMEKKGVDAEMMTNFANYYFSSNNLDALALDSDDRRYSIVNLTEKRLEAVFNQEEILSLAPRNGQIFPHLNEFGYYLMRRQWKDEHFKTSFKSEQTKRIKDASAYDWEKWIIDDFCKDYAGRTITVRSFAEFASTTFKKTTITEKGLRILSEKFPGVFKIVRTEDYEETAIIGNKPGFKKSENPNEKRLICIKINDKDNQTNHEVREVDSE